MDAPVSCRRLPVLAPCNEVRSARRSGILGSRGANDGKDSWRLSKAIGSDDPTGQSDFSIVVGSLGIRECSTSCTVSRVPLGHVRIATRPLWTPGADCF